MEQPRPLRWYVKEYGFNEGFQRRKEDTRREIHKNIEERGEPPPLPLWLRVPRQRKSR